MARKYIKKPLIGDPGVQPEKFKQSLTDEEKAQLKDLESLEPEQLFNLMLKLGVKPTEALGIEKCYEHFEFKALVGGKFSFAIDIVWCKNCYTYFRRKK